MQEKRKWEEGEKRAVTKKVVRHVVYEAWYLEKDAEFATKKEEVASFKRMGDAAIFVGQLRGLPAYEVMDGRVMWRKFLIETKGVAPR